MYTFVFDVHYDGCHKAQLVADGHLTDKPDDSVSTVYRYIGYPRIYRDEQSWRYL